MVVNSESKVSELCFNVFICGALQMACLLKVTVVTR